jgi:hypothetical protein
MSCSLSFALLRLPREFSSSSSASGNVPLFLFHLDGLSSFQQPQRHVQRVNAAKRNCQRMCTKTPRINTRTAELSKGLLLPPFVRELCHADEAGFAHHFFLIVSLQATLTMTGCGTISLVAGTTVVSDEYDCSPGSDGVLHSESCIAEAVVRDEVSHRVIQAGFAQFLCCCIPFASRVG